ncbi:MAG TPA: Fe-S protein assembly chaperone HscA, partial [Vicinamibacterales bacterium]|nr:Fe-S protein assembly chaperone HscA [Vicinamibacterales bacterium]
PAGCGSAMSHVVGIDLGTTNSLVAWVKNGVPEVIRDQSGDALVPSVVAIGEDGTVFVGREAQRRLLTSPSRTVYSVKRFMGRGIDDVRDEAALLPFGIGGEPGGVVRITVAGRELTPPEISAFVLKELKHRAEEFFREQGEFDFEVDRAVITVPAYFNDAQRTATRDAGRIAGLEVLRIINEPTAASLAYGLDKKNRGTIAVYDLGGGTFDISVLKVDDGVFQVLSTNGDTHLGGDDIDNLMIGLVLNEIVGRALSGGAPGGPEGSAPQRLIQEIRKAVIQAKVDLSELDATEITVEPSSHLPQGYRRRITRAEFEALIAPFVERTLGPVRLALEDAGLEPRDIDEAVLVGGSTRIPLVRSKVAELFGRAPHTELNPDEVVALGAAVQADILISGRREMLLLDVTPLSLGIETMGGVTSKIIVRNSTIPASGREMFTTGVDNQTAVDVHVLQGERELAADCRSLAQFKLRGIPPMPAGLPRIEVQFQIDANGILSVAARELRTGIEQTIEVKPSYGLTEGEVERMLIESFEHAEADFAARLLIEARNDAETVILATEKSLRSPDLEGVARTDLKAGELDRIRTALADLKQVMSAPDRELIHEKTHALNHATHHLAEVMMNRSVREALAGKNVTDV